MLSFLNPFILPALLTASIPIILHFFSRRRSKVIPFSSLRFLKLLENQRIRHIRFYQILLLIIRTLFILFLVLAFSRPTLNRSLSSHGSARTTAVLLVDNSYSMQTYSGASQLFDLARKKALQVVQTFDDKDQLFILTPDAPFFPEHPLNKSQAKALLHHLNVSNLSPDFKPMFRISKSLFERYMNFNRELYLFSDLRLNRKVVPDSLNGYFSHPPVRIFLSNPSARDSIHNISIDSVAFKSQFFEKDQPIRLQIQLQNNARHPMETALNIYSKDQRLAMKQISFNGQGRRIVELPITVHQVGYVPLKAEIDDDDLLIDNRYFFSVYIPQKIRILLISDRHQGVLSAASEIFNRNTRLNIRQTDYNHWQGIILRTFDLIVLDDPPSIPTTAFSRLKAFVRSGKNLFVIPGDRTEPRKMNLMLKTLFKNNVFLTFKQVTDAAQFYTINRTQLQELLIKNNMAAKNIKLDEPHIYRYFKIRSQEILLKLQNGEPLLSGVPVGKGKVYLLATRPEMPWSDFPLRSTFIPLLYHWWRSAGQHTAYRFNKLCGQSATIWLPINNPGQTPFTFVSPNNHRQIIQPQLSTKGLEFSIPALNEPGNYFIAREKRILASLSVNVSSGELKPPYAKLATLSKQVYPLKSITQISRLRTGRELWPVLAALALLMLLMEMFLIKRIEGQGVGNPVEETGSS